MKKFRKTLFGWVVSDEGYRVRFWNRVSVEYTDSDGLFFVSCELLDSYSHWAMRPENTRMKTQTGVRLRDTVRRELIAGRVLEVAEFLGIRVDVEA
jgi:hypothetical protein